MVVEAGLKPTPTGQSKDRWMFCLTRPREQCSTKGKGTMKIITLIWLCLLLTSLSAFPKAKQKITTRFYSSYTFNEKNLSVLSKIKVHKSQLPYLKSFWIVYLNAKGQIIGEEYYKNWRLYYYFLYDHRGHQTHKRGFYWHGITDKAFFHVRKRTIWQGYYFKRNPDVWWIYDSKNRLISKTHYKFFDAGKIDYTDRYIYRNNQLKSIRRYRKGRLSKEYPISP